MKILLTGKNGQVGFELQKKLDLKKDEIDFLIKHHRTELIEELEYLKKTNK